MQFIGSTRFRPGFFPDTPDRGGIEPPQVCRLRRVDVPTGLHGDGSSTAYAHFVVEAGRHHLLARLRDTPRESGFDHVGEWEIELAPSQSLVIDFRPESGGFILR